MSDSSQEAPGWPEAIAQFQFALLRLFFLDVLLKRAFPSFAENHGRGRPEAAIPEQDS